MPLVVENRLLSTYQEAPTIPQHQVFPSREQPGDFSKRNQYAKALANRPFDLKQSMYTLVATNNAFIDFIQS